MPITFTTPALTNTAQIGANQSGAKTAAIVNGGYVVAWESDFGGPKNVFFQRFDGAGQPTGGPVQISNTSGQSMVLRDIAVTNDGAFSILTQEVFYTALPPARVIVNSFAGLTGEPTAAPTVVNLAAFGLASDGAELIADPATSTSALIVAATMIDTNFFFDLVRASVTTAGAIPVAPVVVNDNYTVAGRITELIDGSGGQQFALTSGGVIDTVGTVNAFNGALDIIQLSPGTLLLARPAGPSPMVTLSLMTGLSNSIAGYVTSAGVVATTTNEFQTGGARVYEVEVLDLGGGRVLIVWVGDGGDTVPSGYPPFIDGVLAQVYNIYTGAAEGAPVRIKELGLGSNAALMSAVSLSVDLMTDGRVAVGMSYGNGLAGQDVFSAILDPRVAGVSLTARSTGAEFLVGTAFDDTFTGVSTGDQVTGGSGIDTVVFGGNGARFIDLQTPSAFPGTPIVLSGIENLTGSSVSDELRGDALANNLNGGSGDDLLYGRDGNDTLVGGIGNDLVFAGFGGDQIDGGAGLDTLIGADGADVIFGGADADRLFGGNADDMLSGGDANDRLMGEAGNDTLLGDAGADLLIGGLGEDQLFGGAGNDTLRGDSGADSLFGGLDNDAFLVTGDVALVDGGLGVDTLQVGTDFAPGATGFFVDLKGVFDLLGQANTYTRFEGDITSVENLTGGQGHDFLAGDEVANILRGGLGNDVLIGGLGADTLVGGAGADTFVFQSATVGSADTVRDFSIADDSIGLIEGAFADINADNIDLRLTINATGTVGASAVAQFIFDNAGAGFGQLFFDADGNGAGAAVLMATLIPTTGTLVALTAEDFVFL